MPLVAPGRATVTPRTWPPAQPASPLHSSPLCARAWDGPCLPAPKAGDFSHSPASSWASGRGGGGGRRSLFSPTSGGAAPPGPAA